MLVRVCVVYSFHVNISKLMFKCTHTTLVGYIENTRSFVNTETSCIITFVITKPTSVFYINDSKQFLKTLSNIDRAKPMCLQKK